MRIGFIGPGRLGTTLARALVGCGAAVHAVAGRSPASTQRFLQQVDGAQAFTAQALVDSCDLVFLTTADDAIAAIVQGLHLRAGMAVVHCSGATEVAVLRPALEAGAQIGGFHPLQSFADPGAALASLPGCTITLEADPPLDAVLADLVSRLGCRTHRLAPGARARYHAAAGYASQFVNVLLREATQIWTSWGATEAQALQALLPLARGALDSIERAGLAAGMPGPVSRGDVGTVTSHLDALGALGAPTLAFYRLLCERSIALALEAPAGIDQATAGRLQAVLRG